MDASKSTMNQANVISYVSRDITWHIIRTDGSIRNFPVLVAEILAIQNELQMVVQEKYRNVIIKGDSLITI